MTPRNQRISNGNAGLTPYQHGRTQWHRYVTTGSTKEGRFLAGLDKWTTDEDRADYEDGWIDASEEDPR